MKNFFFDWWIGLSTLILSIIGSFIIASVNPIILKPHIISLIVGGIFFIALSLVRYDYFKILWPFGYIVFLLSLIFVLTQPEVRGARRWVFIFGKSIQVSEIGKPLYILSLAGLVSRFGLRNIKGFIVFLIVGLLPLFFILKQPDLGSTILYFIIWFGILFGGRSKLSYIIILVLAGLVFLPVGWSFLADYQKARLISFLKPDYDLQGIGYNSVQALIAVGSGKLTGRGLGQGTQSHLRFLPESDTDFVFASLSEELGFLGGAVLLLVYGIVLFRILTIALKTDNLFPRLIALGVFLQLFTQVFVNIGMNLGLVPITGITLPLVSRGGSSIISTFISLGLVSSLDREKMRKNILIR